MHTFLSRICIIALALLPAPLLAQGPGGEVPQLEIEQITVIGRRTVVLPKARKGEVFDTTLYVLPPDDPMLLSSRLTNLKGDAGPLPGFREFELPLKLDGEASIGSYLSPHALVRAEYIRKGFDVAGMIDFRSTAGHIDSAEARSLLVGGRGSIVVGDRSTPPLKSFRISVGLEHGSDGYFLYGSSTSPFDRSRISNRLMVGIKSEEEMPVSYAFGFELASTGVEDRLATTATEATAEAPAFNLAIGTAIDSTLQARLGLDFTTTSLGYAVPTQTPAYVSVRGDLEWRTAPGTYLTGGVMIANGQNSDSGSSSLIMPRIAARYQASSSLSLFAWFSPELRAATYRERIMSAPYVDRDITLHPERVPVRVAAGVRFDLDKIMVEARGIFESAENTPVVVADSIPGHLRYEHVDSRTIGVEGSVQMRFAENLSLSADAILRSATVRGSGEALPMTPQIDIRSRVDFALNQEIDIFGSILFQTEQRTVLSDIQVPNDARTISPRFILGAGGSYRILENLQAFAEISNLLNYDYDLWQNYSAPGFEVRGGVRVTY